MQGAAGIEVLLDDGKEVFVFGGGVGLGPFGDERVGEGLVRGHAGVGIDGEAAFDELARGEGDAAPVFERGEGVVGDEDGLHLFEVGVPVEGGVAAEEEVGYYADGPDVAVKGGRGVRFGSFWEFRGGLHWFAVACLFEDLGCHVARRSAGCCKHVEGFFVHYS